MTFSAPRQGAPETSCAAWFTTRNHSRSRVWLVTEILQGLTREASRIEHYLSQWEMLEPSGFKTYREAAAIFRLGRAKAVTLTTIDALIAPIALEHRVSVFTLDKDFSASPD